MFCDVLSFKFKHKIESRFDSEGPLHAVRRYGNKIIAYGIDLTDRSDVFLYNNLKFPTEKEAVEAFSRLAAHERACIPYHHNDLNRIHWAVDSTKILDEAAIHTGSYDIRRINQTKQQNSRVITRPPVEASDKKSFIKQLKKVWQIIKGN